MSSKTQDKLFENFLAAAGTVTSATGTILSAAEQLATSLTTAANQASQLEKQAKTSSGNQGLSASSAESGRGVSDTLVSIASSVFKSGLGLAPLVSGLFGLFSGGGSPDPPPLVKYLMPASMDFAGAYSGSSISDLDYDQTGRARAFFGSGIDRDTAASASPRSDGDFPTSNPVQRAGPQITVNVQAMDARSFLDHSTEIAGAVREAMLNLNSINDVVNDL
jgi:hypothetical protein